jgi:isopenicillin N synthase-like dioxygenase
VEQIYANEKSEETGEGCHLLVFCGETLDHATASYFPAMRHQIITHATPKSEDGTGPAVGRISSPFFLRAQPNARVPRLHDRSATYTVRDFEADYDRVN